MYISNVKFLILFSFLISGLRVETMEITKNLLKDACKLSIDRSLIRKPLWNLIPTRVQENELVMKMIKSVAQDLIAPVTMMIFSPERCMIGFSYNIFRNIIGKMIEQGTRSKTLESISSPIAFMLQDGIICNQDIKKKVSDEIILRVWLDRRALEKDLSRLKNSKDEYSQEKRAFIEEELKEKKAIFEELNKEIETSRGKIKQVLKSFYAPAYLILLQFFVCSRFYNLTIKFLKTAPGLSHIYRYIEWVHNRPQWIQNEFSKRKNNFFAKNETETIK